VDPVTFQRKWIGVTLKEKSASQSHFNDLCAVLRQPTPTDADPTGEFYTFERGAAKLGGGDGWDDPDPATVEEDTILARLLALNLERAGRS